MSSYLALPPSHHSRSVGRQLAATEKHCFSSLAPTAQLAADSVHTCAALVLQLLGLLGLVAAVSSERVRKLTRQVLCTCWVAVAAAALVALGLAPMGQGIAALTPAAAAALPYDAARPPLLGAVLGGWCYAGCLLMLAAA